MGVSALNGFDKTDVQLDPPINIPNVSDEITQTLDRLLVWDAVNAMFRLLRSDAGGRIFVNNGPVVLNMTGSTGFTLVNQVDVQILGDNPARQKAIIWVHGLADAIISFKPAVAAVQIFFAPAGNWFEVAGYTGKVTAALNLPFTINTCFVFVAEY